MEGEIFEKRPLADKTVLDEVTPDNISELPSVKERDGTLSPKSLGRKSIATTLVEESKEG